MELIRKCIAYVLPTIGFFFLSSPRLAFLWQVQLQVCVVLAQRSCLHLTKRSWKGEEHNRPWLGSTCCRGKLIFPSFVCWKSKALRCVCVCVCVLGHWVWVCLDWKGCGRPQGLLVVQPQSHHFHMKLIGTLHSFPVRCVCGHLLRSCLCSKTKTFSWRARRTKLHPTSFIAPQAARLMQRPWDEYCWSIHLLSCALFYCT